VYKILKQQLKNNTAAAVKMQSEEEEEEEGPVFKIHRPPKNVAHY
jgi:hypothetical protein